LCHSTCVTRREFSQATARCESAVTGSKLRCWFIEQIDFAGKAIDLLNVGMSAFVDLCIDPRRDQFG
jgi:hypothetical protein